MMSTLRGFDEVLSMLETVALERENTGIAAEASEAREALSAGRFNVAVVGQFKRGKSTLINAMIGRELLPADVAPLTSAITVIQHGDQERCLVRYEDGRKEEVPLTDVALYTSEEGNPGNKKGVRAAVVELETPLLEGGMRLVDTPGVGSVLEPNSEVTRTFIPRVDVAVVVLGSDPPITGEELALVRAIAPRSGHICFVVNKADKVRETTRVKAEAFTRQVLNEALGRDPGVIIQTSALNSLRGGGDPGVTRLIEVLEDFTISSGADLTRRSAINAATHLAARLLQHIDLERAALVAPLAELDGRIARFESSMRDIENLALGVQTRVRSEISYDWKAWESERDAFVAAQDVAIMDAARAACDKVGARSVLRKAAKECARNETRQRVEQWASMAAKRFQGSYETLVGKVTTETNRLLARVSEAAAEAFGIRVAHFEVKRLRVDLQRLPFEFIEPALALDVKDWLIPLIDLFSPRRMILGRVCRYAGRLAKEWIMQSLYQVDEHLTDWIDFSTRSLMEAMRARLDQMHKEVMECFAAGKARRTAGEAGIADRVAVLESQRTRLEEALERARTAIKTYEGQTISEGLSGPRASGS
jgi:hypothetical protein